MKRKLAIAFVAFDLAIVAAMLLVLRSSWAAQKLCAFAERRVEALTGLPFHVEACAIEPLRLQVRAEGVRLGSSEAPVFAADSLRARLAPVKALGRRLHLAELEAVRPRLVLSIPERVPGAPPGPCPPAGLAQVDVGFLSAKKKRDFLKFKEIARLIQAGRHRSKEGIDEILAIRRDMNDGGAKRRKYSDDSIQELFEPGESSETACQASTIDEVVEDDTVRSA